MEVSSHSPSSWWRFVSIGGVASLGVSAALFQLCNLTESRIFELDKAQPLETLASAVRLAPMLPMTVAVRGRVTCREPSKCELSSSPAVMRELLEEEVYFKEHSSGRVTQECFEVRREQEQREAFLEDTTAGIRLDNLQHAAGLTRVMEVKQVFRPVDLLQGTLMQHVINKAFKSMVKHGVRVTERFLPVNTTVTVVGELVPDTVGHIQGHSRQQPAPQPGPQATQVEQALLPGANQGQVPSLLATSTSTLTSTPGWDASEARTASGTAASTSGRAPPSALSAAAAAAGTEVLSQAALAVGSVALQVLPYTLRKPVRGPFYVTMHTLPQLRSGLERTSKTLRAFAWGFGLLGAVLVARKVAVQLWRIREHRRLKRLLAEADAVRRQRQAQRAAGAGAGAGCGGASASADGWNRTDGDGDDEGLRGPGTCVVCLDRDTDVVFSGCGHMCTCYSCTANLQASKCPICRVASRTIRVFRP